MDVVCKWMYAIARFGWPPPWDHLDQVLHEIRELGFTLTELEALGDENLQDMIRQKDRIKRCLTDSGLALANFAVILPDTVSTDSRRRQHARELFKRGVELAAEVGSPRVYMDSYSFEGTVFGGDSKSGKIGYGGLVTLRLPTPDFDWAAFWAHYVHSVQWCNDACKSMAREFTFEPRIGEIVSNSDGALTLAQAVNDMNFGLIFDTAHLHAQKENLAVSLAKLRPYIKYIDVSDNDGRENRHMVPGDGMIDWKTFLDTIRRYNISAPLAIDLEKLPNVQESFRRSLQFIRKLSGSE
jgi:sugar phosphate isomerase/epimerase